MKVVDQVISAFNPADTINWVLLLLLAVLLLLQLALIIRNKSLSARRKWVRAVLNFLFWSVLAGYFLQLEWRKPVGSKLVLLADNTVPAAYINHLKDSLGNREIIRTNTVATSAFRSQLTDGSIDTVTLIGSAFSPEILGQLSRQTVQWIPYYQPDQLQLIRWKAFLRKGEMQVVSGTLYSSQQQMLKLRFGKQILDSLLLKAGPADFKFQFPAFSQGRTEIELVLDQKPLDTLHYFSRKAPDFAYQFILDSPDFESKTLADWLGRKGYSVQLTSTISKNRSNRLNINRAADADVIITDPANATNPVVKKAVIQGKPVLFMNLSDAEADLKTINEALGTDWNVKKIANETTVSIGNGIQALPYRLTVALNQLPVAGYPVAIQKTTAKIGVSLVSETFPLKLSGDSVTYDRIWTSILTPLQPALKDNVQLESPVFKGIRSVIHFNNVSRKPAEIRIGNDTARLDYSPINAWSAQTRYVFGRTGWLPFQDSLAVYVDEPDKNAVFGNRLVSDYLRFRSSGEVETQAGIQNQRSVKLPDWIWILLFLSSLTALWIEPKFSI
ncbi:hypothetical protein GCM10028803_37450 [Larkinella knui]|uniref:Aerotolerance regulator N-terminal domain-containing protein n=1 Tax=Larkinella knui TaxID=2025310 RepID=A0A3P1CEC9_9BACT|nr:hypothetical protein [Larkinella knui]RRB11597.1 hypothetical protein EHT87_24305 [Larkinella knui]